MSKELADRLEPCRDALYSDGHFTAATLIDEAIAALRSEPVAWTTALALEIGKKSLGFEISTLNLWGANGIPLYAAPSREDRAEPVAGQLSAEEIEAKFEAWLRANCFQQPTQEAYELAKCAWKEMALSSLLGTEQCVVHPVMSCVCSRGTKSCTVNHGTFADGIEAAAKLCDELAELPGNSYETIQTKLCAKSIRAYGKSIRALAQGQRTSEQAADELLREVLDWGLPDDLKQRIDAHLSRKEQ